jgi:tetratricopeptide (TPR) repeat protein
MGLLLAGLASGAAAEEASATLKIGSTPPACIVHLDGRRYRKTETVLTLGGMRPGPRTVRFEADGRMVEKRVTLEPGGIGFVFADLRPEADADGSADEAPDLAASPSPARSGRSAARAEPGAVAPADAPAGPDGAPGASIPDADDAFAHAEVLRTAVNPFAKRSRYEEALRLYRKVLERWPGSDKAEACRYQIANIHESVFYRDYAAAIAMYESVLENHPATDFPVRWRIAVLYDNRLRELPEALAWYERSAAESASEEVRERAAHRARELRERLAAE